MLETVRAFSRIMKEVGIKSDRGGNGNALVDDRFVGAGLGGSRRVDSDKPHDDSANDGDAPDLRGQRRREAKGLRRGAVEDRHDATDASYESAFDNGVLDVYAAKGDAPLPLIVYAHGGYYVGDDKADFGYYCQSLAARGYVVANINYQHAPEGRYPTQMLQVNEALRYLTAHAEEYRIDTTKIFIGGDSAGGHLSSQMGLYYTNPAFQARIGGTPAIAKEQLKGVILHCGYYNIDTLRATGFPMIADSVWMMTGVKHYEGTVKAVSMNTVAWITPDYPPVSSTAGTRTPSSRRRRR